MNPGSLTLKPMFFTFYTMFHTALILSLDSSPFRTWVPPGLTSICFWGHAYASFSRSHKPIWECCLDFWMLPVVSLLPEYPTLYLLWHSPWQSALAIGFPIFPSGRTSSLQLILFLRPCTTPGLLCITKYPPDLEVP